MGKRHREAHVYFAQPESAETVAVPLAPLMPLKLADLSSYRIAVCLEAEKAECPTATALSNGWTPERRRRQAQLIGRWRP
jgi:hypothetical protein